MTSEEIMAKGNSIMDELHEIAGKAQRGEADLRTAHRAQTLANRLKELKVLYHIAEGGTLPPPAQPIIEMMGQSLN